MKSVVVGKRFTFEASHFLPFHKGKCSNIHGHRYELTVYVRKSWRSGITQEEGMVVDYGVLTKAVEEVIINELDHKHLNDLDCVSSKHFLNPTAENLILWIAEKLQTHLTDKGLYLMEVQLKETENSFCIWRHDHGEVL